MRKFSWTWVVKLSSCLFLSACSPEHNWREIGFEGTSLKAQLPCKPDRTTRSVPLGGVPVDLQVAGCESAGAMLAVMTAPLPSGADAQGILLGWQQATLRNAGVQVPLSADQQQIWTRRGFLPLTSSVHIQAKGQRADGQAVYVRAAWGAVAEGGHVRLVHAVVYDRHDPAELAANLWDGIHP